MLPTTADLKTYLRIEHAAEDALIALLLARATAMLQAFCDVPITAVSRTFLDRAEGTLPPRALITPQRPIANVVVTDGNTVTVDATTYRVDGPAGIIYGVHGTRFTLGPYTIVCQVGLSLRQDYAAIEPMLSQMILDMAADLYQRRTPGASTETSAATSITWDVSRDLAARVLKDLRYLKVGVAL